MDNAIAPLTHLNEKWVNFINTLPPERQAAEKGLYNEATTDPEYFLALLEMANDVQVQFTTFIPTVTDLLSPSRTGFL